MVLCACRQHYGVSLGRSALEDDLGSLMHSESLLLFAGAMLAGGPAAGTVPVLHAFRKFHCTFMMSQHAVRPQPASSPAASFKLYVCLHTALQW